MPRVSIPRQKRTRLRKAVADHIVDVHVGLEGLAFRHCTVSAREYERESAEKERDYEGRAGRGKLRALKPQKQNPGSCAVLQPANVIDASRYQDRSRGPLIPAEHQCV